MPNQYFSSKIVNPIEKPVQELIELNVKTLQSFSYLNPTELFKVRKPEEFMEKNMDIFIQNGHKALDYMQNIFMIMEKNWVTISDRATHDTKQAISQVQTAAQRNMKEAMDVGQRTAKKVTTNMKDIAKHSVKKAKSVVRKNINDTVKTMKKASDTATVQAKKTVKPAAVKSAKAQVKSNVSRPAKKEKINTMSTSVLKKPTTMNKMDAKIHNTRTVTPVSANPITKETELNINKNKPLM